MLFKLIFPDKTEWAQAKSQLHLLQEYNKKYDDFNEIEEVIELSDDDAKNVILKNSDYNEENPENDMPETFTLFESCHGEDFCILGSTEW